MISSMNRTNRGSFGSGTGSPEPGNRGFGRTCEKAWASTEETAGCGNNEPCGSSEEGLDGGSEKSSAAADEGVLGEEANNREVEMGTSHHSYYWRYRFPANGMLTRLPLRISDEEGDKLKRLVTLATR